MADPWLKTISKPKITRTNNIGNNQYFFLIFKNSQNSFTNDITKIDVSLYQWVCHVLSSNFLFFYCIFSLTNPYPLYSLEGR